MVWFCECGCHAGVCSGENCDCEAHTFDSLFDKQLIDLIIQHSSYTKEQINGLTRNKLYKTIRHIEFNGGDPQVLIKEATRFIEKMPQQHLRDPNPVSRFAGDLVSLSQILIVCLCSLINVCLLCVHRMMRYMLKLLN